MEVLAMVTHLPLPILRGNRMIPDSIIFAAMALTILLATTSWGRKKAENK